MRVKARKIFRILTVGAIFFLTGCAGGRYHRNPEAMPKVPGASLSGPPGTFQWPLEGRVVLPYGAREDGVSIKGILLKGREGQNVYAAQEGTVVFVDENLRGYGKTLILDHLGGFSTVYARNAKILVSTGERVQKGQAIAQIGRAGKGGIPQAYFEVRKSARAEDPLLYLH